MNKDKTAIAVVLDRSGSMEGVVDKTLEGFGGFLVDQKAMPGQATMTTVLFDDRYEVLYVDRPIVDVPKLTKEVYFTRGATALHDALARAIDELGARLAALPEHDRPGRVVVATITDGEENSSREYGGPTGLAALKAKVKHQAEKYGWEFVFLGAGLGAVAQGVGMGIPFSNAAQYNSSNVRKGFAVMSASIGRSRLGQSAGYTVGEVDALMEDDKDDGQAVQK